MKEFFRGALNVIVGVIFGALFGAFINWVWTGEFTFHCITVRLWLFFGFILGIKYSDRPLF